MTLRGPLTLDPLERLRRVQRVSDAALAHVSVDELLDHLLVRVRDVLEADTAAVLLLDPAKNELVARAAKGLEEEVERGVRIPVGKGFAGRIAAERRPVVLDRVDHGTVLNPILFQKGIRSLLGVPLLADGDVVGVMHVGTLTRRRFTDDEVELLQLVADRVALAVRARLTDRTRIVIEAFQRTFMPEVLPYVPGLRIASRYLPAASAVGIGGDWYDTFTLPSGEIVFVIGDVAGHGMPAASLMGRMRNAMRALALSGGSPGEIVARAEEFHRHFGEGELVTLLVGSIPRDLATFRFVSAGHAPPLIVGPSGAAFGVGAGRNAPLGLGQPSSYVEEVVPLRRGTSILLYTDGLVERRGESLEAGLERLHAVGAEVLGSRPPNEAIDQLVSRLLGARRPNDDVALLLIHRDSAAAEELEFAIEARARSLATVRSTVSRWLDDVVVAPTAAREIVTAVSEACANVVEHAYGPGGGMMAVTARRVTEFVEVEVRDAGRWRGSSRGDRGNGLRLIRGLMDEVHIETSHHGTLVRMRRRTEP